MIRIRFLSKALILVLFMASFSTTSFQSPRQGASPCIESKRGRMFSGLRAASSELPSTYVSDIREYAAGGHVLRFRSGGVVIASGNRALRVEHVNARSVPPVDGGKSYEPMGAPGCLPTLVKVTYYDLWDGVTAVYEKTESAVVKSTYYIEPSHLVNEIHLRYNVPVRIDSNGDLVLSCVTGEMRETRPVAWQVVSGAKIAVEAEYRLLGEKEIGFKIGACNPLYPLVIDPIMFWNTFLGGTGGDRSFGIAIDMNGNTYVTGESGSSWGSPVRSFTEGSDAFVAKLDSNGVLQWNTFLGGAAPDVYGHTNDSGHAIAVDINGNIYITGASVGTWGSPINEFIVGASTMAFVAKLNASGALQWNTFLGGGGGHGGNGIAVDTNGSLYVSGNSSQTWGTPIRPHGGSINDGFVAKLDTNGVLQWNTFVGGGGNDEGWGIAIDIDRNSYVSGWSSLTWGTPIRPFSGGGDAYAAKLDANGVLQWHTFLGGTDADGGGMANGIAVDMGGNAYVAGFSFASWGTPLRPFSGNGDAYAAKLDANGVLQWHTFLGGGGRDEGRGIAVNIDGSSRVSGESDETWGTPVRDYAGTQDAFAVKLDMNGTLQWNAFFGAPADLNSDGRGIAVDMNGNSYMTGDSGATWGTPVRDYAGTQDAFVVKIPADPAAPPEIASLSPSHAFMGDPSLTLTVEGSGFIDGSIVLWDGSDRPTTFITKSELNATIEAENLTIDKTVQVSVRNPNGDISNSLEFSIDNPSPSLTALVPSSATAGGPNFVLSVMGSGLVNGAVVRWDGVDRPTTFVNSNEVDATIGVDDIASAKSVEVTVRNPDGRTSNGLVFAVDNPLSPSLTALSPTKISAGGAGFSLTISGTNFVPNSVVKWNGVDKATTYVSGTELHAAILAGDISAGGEVQVTVVNPIPAGSTSNPIIFPVSSISMNASPTSVTVTAGQSAAYAVQVIPHLGSFDALVSLTCTGLPRNASASITPGSVTPGASTVAVGLNIATKANSRSAVGANLSSGGSIPPVLGLLIAALILAGWFTIRKPDLRRIHLRWLSAVALICLILTISSCGAGGDTNPPSNNGTPSGTYQITVQGESGSLKTSITVSLVVR